MTQTTKPIHLDGPAALQVLRDVIADTPNGENFVYKVPHGGIGCVYVTDGQPSCLIGRALVRLGVPIDFFQKKTARLAVISGATINGKGFGSPFFPAEMLADYITFDLEALRVFTITQEYQDTGSTWGRGVALAAQALEQESV